MSGKGRHTPESINRGRIQGSWGPGVCTVKVACAVYYDIVHVHGTLHAYALCAAAQTYTSTREYSRVRSNTVCVRPRMYIDQNLQLGTVTESKATPGRTFPWGSVKLCAQNSASHRHTQNTEVRTQVKRL